MNVMGGAPTTNAARDLPTALAWLTRQTLTSGLESCPEVTVRYLLRLTQRGRLHARRIHGIILSSNGRERSGGRQWFRYCRAAHAGARTRAGGRLLRSSSRNWAGR